MSTAQRNLFDIQAQIGDQLIDMDAELFAVNHQHRIKTYKNETVGYLRSCPCRHFKLSTMLMGNFANTLLPAGAVI
jgi:hypothetical protein